MVSLQLYTRVIWLRLGTNCRLLWTPRWKTGFCKSMKYVVRLSDYQLTKKKKMPVHWSSTKRIKIKRCERLQAHLCSFWILPPYYKLSSITTVCKSFFFLFSHRRWELSIRHSNLTVHSPDISPATDHPLIVDNNRAFWHLISSS